MEPHDPAFTLGLTATAILVIRTLMIPLVVYNIIWSFKGTMQFFRGIHFPTSLYQSVIFFMSTGLLGYHALALLGRDVSPWSQPYSLMLQCLFFLASGIAFIGRRVAASIDFERFYWLFRDNNLGLAVRVAEMNEMDSDYTHEVIEVAESTLAIRLAKKAVDAKSR